MSSYVRKFRMEQLQSHIWLTASSYMRKNLRISSYIRKPFLIHEFATAPLRIPYIWGKFDFLFYQCKNSDSLIERSHLCSQSCSDTCAQESFVALQPERDTKSLLRYSLLLFVSRCYSLLTIIFMKVWIKQCYK
jgi:hypothetical protein